MWIIFTKEEEKVEEKVEKQETSSEVVQQGWKDKMALLIQAYFRKLKKMVNREQDIRKIGRNENIIMNGARIVNGRAITIKMLYLEETKRVRILLFEKATKRTQTFILDNVNFTEVNHNELIASAWKVMEKIEYDKGMQKFFIGLEQSENKDQSISVFSIPQREIAKSEDELKDFKGLILREIYKGIKKVGADYFNISISLNPEQKPEIFILKEKDPLKQRIEVNANLVEFFKLQPKRDLLEKLGRIIYNEVVSTAKGVISFNEEQFREEILKLIFKERNARLKKIQQKYRSYKLQSKFISVITKAKTSRVLVTKFGIKRGKQYHFIKVFTERNKAGVLVIKSDKAKNQLKVKVENLDLTKEEDLLRIKQNVKNKLIKSLAFNPAKETLLLYRNTNNSRFITNASYI